MKKNLLVLTGLSGSGKDIIVDLLTSNSPFRRIVTHNTRPPRKEEKEGYDYHFVSEEKFTELIGSGKMTEYVRHGSYLKGTTKKEFEAILEGNNLIWRIEPSRAAFAEEFFLEKFGPKVGKRIISRMIKVFISVKDNKVLLSRYKAREKDQYNIKEFKKRLKQDISVFEKNVHRFEHIIENNDSAEASAKKILDLLKSGGV